MRFTRQGFTGPKIEWEEARCGARAVKEDGDVPARPSPMLTMEANIFIDMQMRNVTAQRINGVDFTIEP